jgi:hypothetical protein
MHLVGCIVEESLSRPTATRLLVMLLEVLSTVHAVSELDLEEGTSLSPMALLEQTVEKDVQ